MSTTTTQVSICNMALHILGADDINAITDSSEQARILNSVYTDILDEVLASHPWNFAIKRATLSDLSQDVATWTAQGTTNVWQASLTTEPARVKFDGTEGDEKTSVASLASARDWYWVSNILYVYSTSDPDSAYSTITAIVPEFEYDHAYSLPSDCLRLIRMEESDMNFVREANRILTNEDECKIEYIARITDQTTYTPAFITAFAYRLASEIAFPITNSTTVAEEIQKKYEKKLRWAKSIDAQEGSGQRLENLRWEESRE